MMESSEYLRLQRNALAEVEALTNQMERGEIAQAEAETKIKSILKTLERDTATYLPALQSKARLTRLIPWLLAAIALAFVAYRMLA